MSPANVPPALSSLFMSVLSVGCEIVPFLKKDAIVNLMVEAHPDFPGLRATQAFDLWQRGDIDGARQHFEDAARRHADDLPLRAMLCMFLFRTGDPSWEDLLRGIEAANANGTARQLIESVAAEAGIELQPAGTTAFDRGALFGAEPFTRISA